jgi:hypothetical protein
LLEAFFEASSYKLQAASSMKAVSLGKKPPAGWIYFP